MLSQLNSKPLIGIHFQAALHPFQADFTIKNLLLDCLGSVIWGGFESLTKFTTYNIYHLLFIHLAVTGMTQFILDKSTWSIFITLLSSTGLLMDRSFFLWAIRVRLTGLSFSQTSFSLLVVHSPSIHWQF